MTRNHNPKTKKLGSLRLHWFAFDEARTSARLALQYGNSSSPIEQRVSRFLSFQAITAYARPFTRCKGVCSPKTRGESSLIKLRHEISAHTDALHHIYTTRVTIAGGIPINKSITTNLLPFMGQVITESTRELDRITQEITDLEQHIGSLNLPDGDYE